MTPFEKRSVASLALLYATRMLGLFMVLPVFVLYSEDLQGATSVLIGLAIGIYGLSQALFQIPFGSLSDRFGRKPLILLGLGLFLAGSVVAAMATDIYTMIFGRFLQGSGAIASVLMALISDLTSEDSRTKAMAMVGMSIGVSFSLALVLGPLIASFSGLSGIFWCTAAMAFLGMVWLLWFVPNPAQSIRNRESRVFKDQLSGVLRQPELLRLDLGIFVLHMILTAIFIAVPVSLIEQAELPSNDHWWVYLSVMLLSFFAMVPFIIVGEKKRKMKAIFLFAISLLSLSALSLSWTQTLLWSFWLSLFFFFMAFNLLEASLPSLVSKLSPAGSKGTAMGVYSTCQFMGAFVGGLLGGIILSDYGITGVFVLAAVSALIWLFVASWMNNPNPETGVTLSFDQECTDQNANYVSEQLGSLAGVEEAVAVPGERYAYLKVIKQELDDMELSKVRDQLNLYIKQNSI